MLDQPRSPDYKGRIQIRTESGEKIVYQEKGDVALWKHENTKYPLRGYVTIDGTKYLVSLQENGQTCEKTHVQPT